MDDKVLKELLDLKGFMTEEVKAIRGEIGTLQKGYESAAKRADLDLMAKNLVEMDLRWLAAKTQLAPDAKKAFGCLMLALTGNRSAEERAMKEFGFTKALGESTTDTGGGFLVPQQYIPILIELMETYGAFRPNTMVWPMASDSAVAPRLASDLTVYCPGESVAPTESSPAFGQIGLAAKEWMTYTAISRQLDEDSALVVSAIVLRSMARAFAKKEDDIAFNGDGTKDYFNIRGFRPILKNLSGTIAYIAGLYVGTGATFATKVIADLEGVVGLLPQYAEGQARWYCHRTYYFQVMARLALASGGTMAQEVIAFPRERQYLGYPVSFSQVLPNSGAASQVDCLFGDLGMASKLGDRRSREIATSQHVKFAEGQLVIRGSQRVAINVHDVGNASATASARVPGPVVGSIEAAS